MTIRTLSIGAAALLAVLASAPARAADLNSDERPHAYGTPYEDPRYADIYRHPAPPAPPPPPRAYVERYDDRYAPPRREAYGCVPRHVVRQELARRGWSDFHDLQVGRDVVSLRASRPNGAVFDLTLDRCTGEVVERRFVAAPPPPPPAQAWRERNDYRRGGY